MTENALSGGSLPEGAVNVEATVQQPASGPDTSPSVTPMPDGGSEKFYDAKTGSYNWEADAKEKAWQLAQKSGRGTGQSAPATPKDSQGNRGAAVSEEAAKEAVTNAGLDFDAINASIAKGEGVPQDARAALNAAGIPDTVIDTYVGQIEAQAQQHIDSVMGIVGGQEGLKALGEWAMANLPPAEFAELQDAINHPAKAKAALAYYMNQAGMPQGQSGQTVQVKGPNAAAPGTSGAKPFETEAEFLKAVGSREHRTDKATFEHNMARLRASPHLQGLQGFNKLHRSGL